MNDECIKETASDNCYFFLSKVLKKVLNSSHLIGFAMHLKMQLGNFANFEVREVGNVAACSFKYKSSSEVKEIKKQ